MNKDIAILIGISLAIISGFGAFGGWKLWCGWELTELADVGAVILVMGVCSAVGLKHELAAKR